MAKRDPVAIVEPKTEAAKAKLGYHGERWYLRDKLPNRQFQRSSGPVYVLRSRDGKAILYVKVVNDPLFHVRLV